MLRKALYLQDDALLVQPLCSVFDCLLLRPFMAFLLPEEEEGSHHSDASVRVCVCVCVCVCMCACVNASGP